MRGLSAAEADMERLCTAHYLPLKTKGTRQKLPAGPVSVRM
jgi:hypothetical protein